MAFIEGNSRCIIEIDGKKLRKISPTAEYSPRLQRQIQKQRSFSEANRLKFCRTPAVLSEGWDGGIYHVEMEYAHARDFVEFIMHASRDDLDRLVEQVGELIAAAVSASKMSVIPFHIVRQKLESIATATGYDVIGLLEKLPQADLNLPIGACHGDLTLSNILFGHGGLVVIDFLDSFIESPLQDMVKIRQDTFFQWSLQLYKLPCDYVRTQLALKYLDDRFQKQFQAYEFYRNHYSIFQFLNLARILPYCHTDERRRHVLSSFQRVVNDYV